MFPSESYVLWAKLQPQFCYFACRVQLWFDLALIYFSWWLSMVSVKLLTLYFKIQYFLDNSCHNPLVSIHSYGFFAFYANISADTGWNTQYSKWTNCIYESQNYWENTFIQAEWFCFLRKYFLSFFFYEWQ